MGIEEEILNKAFEYIKTYYDDDIFSGYISRQAFIEGAKYAVNTLIDKSCEWMDDIDFDMEYWSGEDGFCKERFINAFKKEMSTKFPTPC